MTTHIRKLHGYPLRPEFERELEPLDDLKVERALPLDNYANIHPRLFMLADLAEAQSLPESHSAGSVRIRQWSEGREEESAALIAGCGVGTTVCLPH